MQTVHVLAIITAKTGMRDRVLAAFRANVPAVHAEAGCIEYGATIDAEVSAACRPGSETTPSWSSKNGRVSMP